MKNLAIILLSVLFAGIGLAEKPKIVDPPRPTRNYRYLVVTEIIPENSRPEINHIYLDSYKISKDQYERICIKTEKDYEVFWGSTFGNGTRYYISKMQSKEVPCFPIASDANTLKFFLVARAPKPRKTTDNKKREKSLIYLGLPKPRKAEVVFTQK